MPWVNTYFLNRVPSLTIKARKGPDQAGNARILGISEEDAHKD
jgi:hypothetical protein